MSSHYSQENSELIEKARSANLADYFTQNGYETERIRNELHVKGYGGLFVNIETNEWYCFSQSGKGGKNAVNCLTDVIGLDFKSAVEALSGSYITDSRYHTPTAIPQKSKELLLPKRADNMRHVFAYLCKSRGIDSIIVSELAKSGLLYQDNRGNAVFLHKDENGKNIGAEIQGTNTYKRYKGVAAGTSDSVFRFSVGDKPNRVYAFESAIDLMSFYQLANKDKLRNSVLVSMAGLKPNALKPFLQNGMKIYACVDNDEAGRNFIAANNLNPCNDILREHGVKDFNELLQKQKNQQHIQQPEQQKSKISSLRKNSKIR